VTTNEHHMKNIMGVVKEVAKEGKSSLFLFKTISSIGDFQKAPAPTPHVLTEPWQRVGLEALTIDQA
jgi:hypothetical protein